MTTYIALLRAVNVGGTGKLPMPQLKALCAELGYRRIETYIASGNVVFDCGSTAEKVRAQLEKKSLASAGKPIGVFVRTAEEMRTILDEVRGRAAEEIQLGLREIYVYYPSGMGQSKLRIPAARLGTARNLNTVAKLVEMSSGKAKKESE